MWTFNSRHSPTCLPSAQGPSLLECDNTMKFIHDSLCKLLILRLNPVKPLPFPAYQRLCRRSSYHLACLLVHDFDVHHIFRLGSMRVNSSRSASETGVTFHGIAASATAL